MIGSFLLFLSCRLYFPFVGVVNHASSSETFFLIDETGIEYFSLLFVGSTKVKVIVVFENILDKNFKEKI